jgi:hypothetical protein
MGNLRITAGNRTSDVFSKVSRCFRTDAHTSMLYLAVMQAPVSFEVRSSRTCVSAVSCLHSAAGEKLKTPTGDWPYERLTISYLNGCQPLYRGQDSKR